MKKMILLISLGLMTMGCQSMYNTAMEKFFGVEKRQLLKGAVESVNKEQKAAQEQFKDAMTQLKELYAFQGGNLEVVYNKFKASYDDSQSQADVVRKRFDNMENVAKSMFNEWADEINQYTNATFAENSRRQLGETKVRYAELSQAVRESEKSMDPVLNQLRDHVLYLKHNLNAAALGTLQGEGKDIQTQIETLIQRMNNSIAEADSFIRALLKE